MVIQRPREIMASRVQKRARPGVSLGARALWDKLAVNRTAGGNRSDSARQARRLGAEAPPQCLNSDAAPRGLGRPADSASSYPFVPCVLQVLCIRAPGSTKGRV